MQVMYQESLCPANRAVYATPHCPFNPQSSCDSGDTLRGATVGEFAVLGDVDDLLAKKFLRVAAIRSDRQTRLLVSVTMTGGRLHGDNHSHTHRDGLDFLACARNDRRFSGRV
ncbi:hypothetical protein LSAT2_027883 [Lamellibrachia satsuma]|nr:hypothetical protein LSAT2_027883 [Lamellibrachia satsuma]